MTPVARSRGTASCGIAGYTISAVPMTLRLTDPEGKPLRRRAELESRSMPTIARQAVREYVTNQSRAELSDQVLDEELPPFAEALKHLGR